MVGPITPGLEWSLYDSAMADPANLWRVRWGMPNAQVDAWMFMAVAHGRREGRHATLEDLLAAADWINHAIPTDEELLGGLNRLISAGLLESRGNGFVLTHLGAALFMKVQKRAGLWKQFDRLAVEFAELPTPMTPSWTPDPTDIEVAIAAYQNMAAAILKSVSGSGGKRRPQADRA